MNVFKGPTWVNMVHKYNKNFRKTLRTGYCSSVGKHLERENSITTLDIYFWSVPPGFCDRSNEHKIKQTLLYLEELAIFQEFLTKTRHNTHSVRALFTCIEHVYS